MKKLALLFTILFYSCKSDESSIGQQINIIPKVDNYTYSTSNSISIFNEGIRNTKSNDLNQNQYARQFGVIVNTLLDLETVKKSNNWVGITSYVVNDFNNDGFVDFFLSFMGSENESIPFKLFIYDNNVKKYLDKSLLIKNNIGQPFNRKAMGGDLNGDRIMDFIGVSHPESSGSDLSYLDIVLSDGSGWTQKRIKTASRSKSEGYFHGFALGDIDNDKDLDVVVAMWHNEIKGITSYINDGKGSFEEKQAIIPSGEKLFEENTSFTQELSDLNNDGCLDLIYWGTINTYIKFGNCNGTFGGNYIKLNESFCWDYKFTDLNNDNLKDLVIYQSNNNNKIIIYKNEGSLTKPIYTKNKEYDVKFNVSYIDIKDLNNDGFIDIIPVKFLDGSHSLNFEDGNTFGYYPKNEILLGDGNINFKTNVYPITTPIESITYDNSSSKLSWVTTHLTNVDNPFGEKLTMQNLRGDISEWRIYISSSPIENLSDTHVKKIIVPFNSIEKELKADNTFKYSFLVKNDLLETSYIRINYIDKSGIENNLSYEIKLVKSK